MRSALCLVLLLAACGDDNGATHDAGADQSASDKDLAGYDGAMTPSADGGDGPCNSQCDCPAGTLCTIDHVCMGLNGSAPYTALCDTEGKCPCGYTCVDGYCPPLVGSLTPCAAPCDCGATETCVDNKCVTTQYGGGGASCTGTNTGCEACVGTVCLPLDGDPGDSGFCGKPSQCYVDMNCVSNIAFGQECICPNGTDSSCAGAGNCQAFPGTLIADGPAFNPPGSPSGGCEPSEISTVNVTANASYSKLTFYGEVDAGGGIAMMRLNSPDAETTTITVGGGTVYIIIQPVTPVPTTIDGTWTLCAYATEGGSYNVIRWAIYAE
jgi:hypothetical protein